MDEKIKMLKLIAIIASIVFALFSIGIIYMSIRLGVGAFDSSTLMFILIAAIGVLQLWKMYIEEK